MHSPQRADAHRRTLRRHHLQRAPGHDRSGEWKFSSLLRSDTPVSATNLHFRAAQPSITSYEVDVRKFHGFSAMPGGHWILMWRRLAEAVAAGAVVFVVRADTVGDTMAVSKRCSPDVSEKRKAIDSLADSLWPKVRLISMDCEINDHESAKPCVNALLENMR